MNQPNAVKNQADEADRMIAALASGNTEQSTPVVNQAPTQEPAKPVDASVVIDYEQRYKVLQGKYNAEVPQLRNKVLALQEQLKQPLQANQSKPANVSDAIVQLQKDYGDEFTEQIKALVQSEIAPMNNRVNHFENTAQATSKDQKCKRLAEMLAPNNIDFYATDDNPDFHTWLHGLDHKANQPRQALLMDAFTKGDLERAVVFYREFAGSNAQPTKQPNPLEQHVQANTHGAGGGDVAPTGDRWTTAQINAFYKDATAGKLSPEEVTRYEASIFYATNNGLVIDSNFN